MSKKLSIDSLLFGLKEEIGFYKDTGNPIPEIDQEGQSKLEAYLDMPFQTAYGQDLYPSVYDKATILFYIINKGHALGNGNKRASILASLFFLYENGIEPDLNDNELYKLAKYVAGSKSEDKDKVLKHIKLKLKNMSKTGFTHKKKSKSIIDKAKEKSKLRKNKKKEELPSFHVVFKVDKRVIFEVSYYRLGNNKDKYFSTSAAEFNRNRTDYDSAGQAQKRLLTGRALSFYEKFDPLHLKDLSKKQYNEVVVDINKLKEKYKFIENNTDDGIRFREVVELSRSK